MAKIKIYTVVRSITRFERTRVAALSKQHAAQLARAGTDLQTPWEVFLDGDWEPVVIGEIHP